MRALCHEVGRTVRCWGVTGMTCGRLLVMIAGSAGLVCAAAGPQPARADVRAGAEAWTRGDYARAVTHWQDPAARGDADAQFNLGQAYKLGRGVPRDLAKAEELFGKAAAKGHVVAADNYGLLLFDRGERAAAMLYVSAAARRGDPRAQYLQGIAHFNGDLAPKDWVRAYALVTLAHRAELPQAQTALAQMDGLIPPEQRQQGAVRAAQLARPAARAVPDGPDSAGADYVRPAAPKALSPPGRPAAPQRADGVWRIQLGAFGVAGNADALWARLKLRRDVQGHPRIDVKAGKVTKLQAGGYASREAAAAACAGLEQSGITCVPTRN